MSITLIPQKLEELDRLDRDLLVLSFFSNERPLRGLNGLADWRCNGRLSRMLMKQKLTGEMGERTLMTSNNRLSARRVFLFGLGPCETFNNMVFVRAVEEIMTVVSRLKADSLAFDVPGSRSGDEYLLERLAILIKEIRLKYDGAVKLIIGGRENFKDLCAKFDLILEEMDKVLRSKRGFRHN